MDHDDRYPIQDDASDEVLLAFLLRLSVHRQRRLLRILLSVEEDRARQTLQPDPSASSAAAPATASQPPGYPVKRPPVFAKRPAPDPAVPPAVQSLAERRIRARQAAEPQPEPVPRPVQPEPLPEPIPALPAPVPRPTVLHAQAKVYQHPPAFYVPCQLPCANPACNNRCGRVNDPRRPNPHRHHFCTACHRNGWRG